MEAVIETILQACADGDPDALMPCLQYGLDLNFVTENGLTPLMYAVTYAGIATNTTLNVSVQRLT